MIVNFEFLGSEPIENVITSMHYKIDKTVFVGFNDTVQKLKATTEDFLRSKCGVGKVVFHSVSQNDLQSVIKTLRKEIDYEISLGNDLFFDITGGESLVLVAFGMLAKEYKAPIHIYDIAKNKLTNLDALVTKTISDIVPPQNVKLDLADFIKLHGGVINENMHKSAKNLNNPEFSKDVEKLWGIARKHESAWNPFSEFMRTNMVPEHGLKVKRHETNVVSALRHEYASLDTLAELNELLQELADAELIENFAIENQEYHFEFKNEKIKDLIWEGGSILELHVYQQQKVDADDCNVGVHLDWDGVIHAQPGEDVLNEIDVLSIKDNIPTFVSCKSGKLGHAQSMHALYELRTVTERFGGKYAKMVLALSQEIAKSDMLRAEEMGIKVELHK